MSSNNMDIPNAIPPTPDFPTNFHVAVDVVALTINRGVLQVAVVQRHGAKSCIFSATDGYVREVDRTAHDYALPGGHVHWQNENLVDAALRELFEETAVEVSPNDLVQLGAYGDVGRDPRSGRTISIAFVAFHPSFSSPFAGSDAVSAKFMDVVDVLARPNGLEFDHERILRDAITRVRELMERTPIALKFCPDEFTLRELRSVYEVIFHHAYNPDANTNRYAERLRKYDAEVGGSPLDEAIGEFSRKFAPLAELNRLSSDRSTQRETAVLGKIEKLLTDEYRRSSSNRPTFKRDFDPANFARKAIAIDGFIEEIPGESRLSASGTGEPAQVYRRGKAKKLDPPLIVERKPGKPEKTLSK